MKILIDVCHPAHVHFYKHTIFKLFAMGVETLVTCRDKDCTRDLLTALSIPYHCIPEKGSQRWMQLMTRNYGLAQFIKQHEPTLLTAVGGTFVAQVGWLKRIPRIIFYDGDNARLQNAITYPFASLIVVPDCYQRRLPAHHIRYQGFQELAYLHPNYFQPDPHPKPNKPMIFIRHVANQANHDIGHHGLNPTLIRQIIAHFTDYTICISAEAALPSDLAPYRYQGKTLAIHQAMSAACLYVGDSPTMAIEAALLGVPGCFVSTHNCGNINAIARETPLIRTCPIAIDAVKKAMSELLQVPSTTYQKARDALIARQSDVTQVILDCLLSFDQVKQARGQCLARK